MQSSTIYVLFLLRTSYMFRHCRHLRESYTNILFKHNNNHFKKSIYFVMWKVHILIKNIIYETVFYTVINISYFYGYNLYYSPLQPVLVYIHVHLFFLDPSCIPSQYGVLFSVYYITPVLTTLFYIFYQKVFYWYHKNVCFFVNYLLLCISKMMLCKLPEYGEKGANVRAK